MNATDTMTGESTGTNQPPSISVVIATRDRLELLRGAVAAVREQQYEGTIETIVVIDGGEHPLDLANNDPTRPVTVIGNTRRQGLAGARNTGINAAKFEFIAFCDDDDVWHADKLARQVPALMMTPAALLATTGMTVVREGKRIERVHPASFVHFDAFVASRVQAIHPSSFLFRAEAFERVGLVDEDLPGSYAEDHDLLLRVADAAPVVNVPTSLLDVHWHPGSFFTDRWVTVGQAMEHMLAKHPALRAHRRGHARHLGRWAFASAATGDRRKARSLAFAAVSRWPFDRRAWAALVIASGFVRPARALRAANAVGRGI